MRATWFLVPQLSVAFLLEEKDASINELKEPPTLISIDAKESPTLSAGGAMESAMKSAKDVQAMSPATVPMAFVEKVQANEGNGGPAPVGPAAEDPVPVESEYLNGYLNGYGYGHGGPAPVGPAAEEKMVNKDRDIVERFAQEKADEWGRHWLENVLPLKLEDDGSNWATIQRAVKLIYEQERVLTDFWRQQVNLDEDLKDQSTNEVRGLLGDSGVVPKNIKDYSPAQRAELSGQQHARIQRKVWLDQFLVHLGKNLDPESVTQMQAAIDEATISLVDFRRLKRMALPIEARPGERGYDAMLDEYGQEKAKLGRRLEKKLEELQRGAVSSGTFLEVEPQTKKSVPNGADQQSIPILTEQHPDSSVGRKSLRGSVATHVSEGRNSV